MASICLSLNELREGNDQIIDFMYLYKLIVNEYWL